MNEEEKEQWLYEEYKYTSNFDFNRLDKYEEANNDLCIDDLILDYTMLYEHYKKEIERLNKRIEDLKIINEEHQILNGMIRKELQQKENIIKEVREYIQDRYNGEVLTHTFDKDNVGELLNILKGVDKE